MGKDLEGRSGNAGNEKTLSKKVGKLVELGIGLVWGPGGGQAD